MHDLAHRPGELRLLLDQLDAGAVVAKRDGAHVDAFRRVHLLLEAEHVRVEQALQLFICVVDAERLELVELENLENQQNRGFRLIPPRPDSEII